MQTFSESQLNDSAQYEEEGTFSNEKANQSMGGQAASARQAVVEKITVNPDGSFQYAEMTSQGFEGTLAAFGRRYPANCTCYLRTADGNIESGAAGSPKGPYIFMEDENTHIIRGTWDESVAGFRYFNFGDTTNRTMNFTTQIRAKGLAGRIDLLIDNPETGTKIGEIVIPENASQSWYNATVPVTNVTGTHAIFMVFNITDASAVAKSELCDVNWFEFSESSSITLSTSAHNIKAGDYFTLNTAFTEVQSSNAIILNYTFDGNLFEYTTFSAAKNVTVLDVQSGKGFAKITLMLSEYKAGALGDLMLRAKADGKFKQEQQNVALSAEFVLKNDADIKTISTATAKAYFTTLDGAGKPAVPGDTNADSKVDLIDLSNMIDWFGINSTNQSWQSRYIYFDFDNNGSIDIYDISYVARLIK